MLRKRAAVAAWCAADRGSDVWMGPGSAAHPKWRCAASGTRSF